MVAKPISVGNLLLVLMLSGLAACSTDNSVGLPLNSSIGTTSVTDGLVTNSQSPVALLLREAESLRQQGQLELAASRLERGIRAWPSDAAPWYLLAVVRSNQGQWEQTEHLARKSIDKARGRVELVMKNWWLISLSREKRGDRQGSVKARQRALDLIGEN